MFHSGEMVPVCATVEEALSLLSYVAFIILNIWGFPQVNVSTHNLHTRFTCAHTSFLLRERAKKLQNKSGSWYDWNESKQIIFEHKTTIFSLKVVLHALWTKMKITTANESENRWKVFSVALRRSRLKNFPPFVWKFSLWRLNGINKIKIICWPWTVKIGTCNVSYLKAFLRVHVELFFDFVFTPSTNYFVSMTTPSYFPKAITCQFTYLCKHILMPKGLHRVLEPDANRILEALRPVQRPFDSGQRSLPLSWWWRD